MLTLQNILASKQEKEITPPSLLATILLLKIFILANSFLKDNAKSSSQEHKVQNLTVLSPFPACLNRQIR